MTIHDVAIIGAGPCGLAAAIAAKGAGLRYVVLEQGCVVHTIFRFPTQMTFFSTPELLSIGDVPFIVSDEKPARSDALQYFRKVTEAFGLDVRLYERVEALERAQGPFLLRTVDRSGAARQYRADSVIVATGYFDHPNRLGIPGEELPKVSHYYREGHPYFGQDVLVVGGQNSAAEAALDLYRCGARIILAHRGEALSPKVKPWVRPVIESALEKGRIPSLFSTRLLEVREGRVLLDVAGEERWLKNDHVFALTGFRPDHSLLRRLGVEVDEATGAPSHNPETMETNVPDLYLAGVVAAGYDANKIFIENGRLHGGLAVAHISGRRAAG